MKQSRPPFVIRYGANPSRGYSGVPLEKLNYPRKGKWTASDRYAIVRTAKSWGMTPEQFRALPYREQLEMMAEVVVSNQMEEYEVYLMEKKAAKGKEQ